MKRATENRGNIRTHSAYFSPRSKAKDHALQERSLPNFPSSLQETPMKPSQVPKQLPQPPRRMLPLQSPELCHRDKRGPPRQPSNRYSGFLPGSQTNTGSSVNRPHHTLRDRTGPLHYSAQPPGSLCLQPVPVSQANSAATPNRPQPSSPSSFHPAYPQLAKDANKSSHIRTDQATESKIILSYSGSKNATAQRQESNKAQSSNMRNSMPTVELHRLPVTPSLITRAAQEVSSRPHSEECRHRNRSRGSSPVIPCKDQKHKQTPSSEKLTPASDLDHSSQKRRKQFGDGDEIPKKVFLHGSNSGKAQTPKPTAGNSPSTSRLSQLSSGDSSFLELSSKITDGHLCTEPACDQSASLELSSTLKPTQSSCTLISPKPCIKRQPSMGAKQAYISLSHNNTLKLKELKSSSKPGENDRGNKSSLLSSDVPYKDSGSSRHLPNTLHSTSVLSAKTPSRSNSVEENRRSDSRTHIPALKPSSSSTSCRKRDQNKIRLRKPSAIPDDIKDLFTPDPTTFVLSHKTAKPKISPAEKSCSSSSVSSSRNTVTGSPCLKTQNFTKSSSPQVPSLSSECQSPVSVPTVVLKRIKLENLKSSSDDSKHKKSPLTSSGRLHKEESVKCDEKHTSLLHNNVRPCTLETDAAVCEQTSTLHSSPSPLLERQASEGSAKPPHEEDSTDMEQDLGQSFVTDLADSQSSQSSEEDQLLSLKEMIEHVSKPPETPEKGTFSEPSTPRHHSCPSKTQPLPATTKPYIYKNNLDQMLKEIKDNKKTKEIERQLLNACEEDLLRIAEFEEAEENRDEGISTEHQEFLQRYSLMSCAIREVPPGEVVFNLENFGRIFNQDSLQLRQCMVSPQGRAQKTLLWSSPAQLKLNVTIGLFQEAYDCRSPCPTQVTRFLFKMMSVHNERMVSEKILQVLCDIACTAAYQIVNNGSQQFNVWVPSLADVTLVLMNMGAAFVTLFPFENLQPPFTEGVLLEDINISENPSSMKDKSTFPEHNYSNILKYLSYCMDLCSRAYSDEELLLLLTVLGRVSLDTRLILQSSVELYPLQYKIVNNIRDWDTMMPRICLALTGVTDDHHNMCLLVQMLPDNTRGKQLRRHLSLSMISKLLDGTCTYRATEKDVQLSELRPYLPRMQPSALVRGMLTSSRTPKDNENMATLDQQAYYLCYSLLTLVNEASKFQFFPAHQKKQLLRLSSELETYIKCDIRENEKCLYRFKVKDLVARIYTKWEMLLQRTRPLNGRLYDFWEPSRVDTLTSSEEELEMSDDDNDDDDDDDDGEGLVLEKDEEEESSRTEENDDMIAENEVKEEEDDKMDDRIKKGEDTEPGETEGDDVMDDTNETKEATEWIEGESDSTWPEMKSEVMNEHIEAENEECTEHLV